MTIHNSVWPLLRPWQLGHRHGVPTSTHLRNGLS